MKHIKAAIFDMDGTIVDNMVIHTDAWLTFLNQHGIPIEREMFVSQNHGNISEMIRHFFGHNLTDHNVHELGQEKERLYREMYSEDVKEIPGLTAYFDLLKGNDVKIGLATMGDQPNIDHVIDRLGIKHYFDSIIGGHQDTKGKPHPEIFQKSIDRLGGSIENSIVFEDSHSGITSASNAGIPIVGITTMLTVEQLVEAGCLIAIGDYRDKRLYQ